VAVRRFPNGCGRRRTSPEGPLGVGLSLFGLHTAKETQTPLDSASRHPDWSVRSVRRWLSEPAQTHDWS